MIFWGDPRNRLVRPNSLNIFITKFFRDPAQVSGAVFTSLSVNTMFPLVNLAGHAGRCHRVSVTNGEEGYSPSLCSPVTCIADFSHFCLLC